MSNTKINFLTFDIEEWFHANYNNINYNSNHKSHRTNLEFNVNKIIKICDKYNVKSTCFVLGEVAKKNPSLIRKLFDAGHEIASHSSYHKKVSTMSQQEFKKDLQESTDILEQITGEKIVGFRAPSWSIEEETTKWYYETLAQSGYLYSSSVYPARHKLFGIANFDKVPHYPSKHNILEIPQSTTNIFGFECGYAGGAFLRIFPKWFIAHNIKKLNRQNLPVFLYLHPRELDNTEPRLKLKHIDAFFHYYNTGIKCEQKISGLIEEFSTSFMKMNDFCATYHK